MSPGGTMVRVYATLKAQVMSGAFAPGDRLDPARLSGDLAASVTPVRDALHRLTGERLIESWQQEGFRVPFVTETALRDLYGWSADLMAVVARAAERSKLPADADAVQEELPDAASFLLALAARSPNFEHRAAVTNLNDRSASLRPAEALVIDDDGAVGALIAAIGRNAWPDVRTGLADYYRRRMRHVAGIAALMRPRDPV